jgi:hypothetical protein
MTYVGSLHNMTTLDKAVVDDSETLSKNKNIKV